MFASTRYRCWRPLSYWVGDDESVPKQQPAIPVIQPQPVDPNIAKQNLNMYFNQGLPARPYMPEPVGTAPKPPGRRVVKGTTRVADAFRHATDLAKGPMPEPPPAPPMILPPAANAFVSPVQAATPTGEPKAAATPPVDPTETATPDEGVEDLNESS